MNGHIFRRAINLIKVELRNNKCINEDFSNKTRVSAMPEIISQQCGFCGQPDIEICVSTGFKDISETLNILVKEVKDLKEYIVKRNYEESCDIW